MNRSGFLDITEAVIYPILEEQWADTLRRKGRRVIRHAGHNWVQTLPGFYQSTHWLAAPLTPEEATWPTILCWGFRVRLSDEFATQANGTMPTHLCSHVASYTEQSLPPKRRSDLRRCHKRVQIVQLKDPQILLEQGMGVLTSAFRRTGYGQIPEPEEYRDLAESFVKNPQIAVMAGLVDDRLAGYLIARAIDDVAYIENVCLATEFLSTAVGTGLAFDFVQICRRLGIIRQVVYGLHSIEDPRLCEFKHGMGFPVVHLPTRVRMLPVIRTFLRLRYPDPFYRLTGWHASATGSALSAQKTADGRADVPVSPTGQSVD